MQALKHPIKYPTFNGNCPECGETTERYPEGETAKIHYYRCRNGHQVMVETKTSSILSVMIPFKHLKACPKCGRIGLKIVSESGFLGKEGNERLVIYTCPAGHHISHRQLVVRKPGLVWLEEDEY